MSTPRRKSDPTRVLLVEDNDVVRRVIKRILGKKRDITVCGGSGESKDVLGRIEENQPTLVLLDLSLRGHDGLQLTRRIHERFRHVHILVFSMHSEELFAERALRLGAHGYLRKGCEPETLVDAVRKVARGDIYISEAAERHIMNRMRGEADSGGWDTTDLTDRQIEVFGLLCDGMTVAEIAKRLDLHVKTVEAHRAKIRSKLVSPVKEKVS